MIDKILKRLGYSKMRRRNFSGANTGRLYSSWPSTSYSADAELRNDLRALRARSRELANNNDYAKKFIRMVKTNVIGQNGIRLQSIAKTDNNKPDQLARIKIEEGFDSWSKKGICEISGKYSFRDVQNLVMGSTARDGEVLVRFIRKVDNDFGFALQLLEADHLDDRYNDTRPNGNKVKMGIEYNEWNRPVRYWIHPSHPGDLFFTQSYGERIPVDANDMLHIFLPIRISQGRGIPWMHAALTRLNMIGAYEEAELVAARMGAAKNGFYYYEKGEGEGEYPGDDTTEEGGQGSPIQEAEAGHYELLPYGLRFKENDPQHPTTAYKDFIKALLRGIASGVDVSYNFLSNDLEGVNYSSIRAGVLDERDVWRDIQAWISEHFHQVVFEKWLEMAILTGAVKLTFRDFDRWIQTRWQPRGWQWVDPLKDSMSTINEIKAGLKTGSMAAAEKGLDLEETYQQLSYEEELRKKYGIKVSYDLDLLETLAKIQETLEKIEVQNEKN